MKEMATSANNHITIEPTLNLASIYFLRPIEVSQKLVTEVFSGTSYGDWRRAMNIALNAKNKYRFVDGTLPKPAANNPYCKP